MRFWVILSFLLLFIGCSPRYDEYSATHEDLLCRTFDILNEYAYRDTSMLTTRVRYDCSGNFTIEEKQWRVDGGVVSWVYAPDGSIVTQKFRGKIVSFRQTPQWEVITFHITRLNGDGSEVIGGYKDMNIQKGTYSGKPVLRLADVGWQDLGGGGEWGEKHNGDTSYFYEVFEE